MRFVTTPLRNALAALAAALVAFSPAVASAQNGMPQPWEINLQPAATEVATFIHWFHDWVNVLIFIITLFVLALLVYVAWRFNEKRNPVASKTTHHALLEVAWTIVPVLILVVIAIPSFRLLKLQLEIPQADMTVKVTGKQWYWSYEYPQDGGSFGFDSLMLDEKQRAEAISSKKIAESEAPRLLAVDNEAVVRQDRARAGHRRRRHPQIRDAGLRPEDRRHPRPPERDLVQGRPRRHLLRPVLVHLRPEPRLHADRHPRRQPGALHGLARGSEAEVRQRGRRRQQGRRRDPLNPTS
jgi:heme/copper-type cytochrome/quinol oxidase subunit 2